MTPLSTEQDSADLTKAIDDFIAACEQQDAATATDLLRAEPGIATHSLHAAAVLGLPDVVSALIVRDPSQVMMRAGETCADPLLFLCVSPFHGQSVKRDAGLLEAARLLLDAGANPNTRGGAHNLPALYAVTGLRSVAPIAALLLAVGANPTDGESVFHAAERFHEDALELLWGAGVDLNATGQWGNTPLYFLLRGWNVDLDAPIGQGMRWLLEHGADPDIPCGPDRENALHAAVRRGQSAAIVRLLLDRGARADAPRGDGATAWLIARRGGFDELAELLESAGAVPHPLSPTDALLAACSRGDVDTAIRLASPDVSRTLGADDLVLLGEAAGSGRTATVQACLAAGFPVDTTDPNRATALHHAAINGRAEIVRMLIDAGAALDIRDREHSSTALGWAFFGADHVARAGGDYSGCVRALLDAGAQPRPDEHEPEDSDVRGVLRYFRES